MKAVQPFVQSQNSWVNEVPSTQVPIWIALAAGLSLFLELAIIRWHGSMLSLFAFYKNFSLLSVFLGLGIGYALGSRKAICLAYVILGLFTQCTIFWLLRVFRVHHLLMNPVSENLTMGLDVVNGVGHWGLVMGFLALMFTVNTATVIPIGQVTGALMARIPNLKAYGTNLIGSFIGILLFTSVSYLWTPPAVWFAISILALFVMMRGPGQLRFWIVGLALIFIILCDYDPKVVGRHVFTPYQMLTVQPTDGASRVIVSVNHLYYQKIHDFSNPEAAKLLDNYNLPFRLVPNYSNVLVVGAGTGNDVAAALAHGADHVDAVEIDPIIHKLGAELNPTHPYKDPRVASYITDARGFVRSTDHQYGLVLYGLLDSHTMLSTLSNVRLDSFVYTVEGFRESLNRLEKDGVMVVTFSLIHDDLGRKLYLMLKEAAGGKEPIAVAPHAWNDGGVMFFSGPGVTKIKFDSVPLTNITTKYSESRLDVVPSTDDWPFFYMPRRTYPFSYLAIIVVLLLLSFYLIATRLQLEFSVLTRNLVSSSTFFFMGAGFMLIETRAITELGLVFGNTWLVVAVVISAILAASYLSNLTVMALKEIPPVVTLPIVGASLLIGWRLNLTADQQANNTLALIVTACPLFFSGLLFSSTLKEVKDISTAMAFNLFGAMCGGLLEYNSMYFGFRSLYLFGFCMYALAGVGFLLQKRRASATAIAYSSAIGSSSINKAPVSTA